MEAIELQLVAFKEGIAYWIEMGEIAKKFVSETTERLSEIKSSPSETNRLLLEITDVSKESLRAMTNLPRRTAERFIGELDEFERARKSSKRARKSSKKSGTRPKAKRFVRAKP